YPARAASERVQTNFAEIGRLDFEEPDTVRFPSLNHARRAGDVGGTLPAVLNAANEVAVQAFCDEQIGFTDITRLVGCTMDAHKLQDHPSLDQIIAADAWARDYSTRAFQPA
ncbi:MAG: 1-deoxy-D-xylulose-5-phosphate reductoisomerase, partial [Verrucomicrobiales bacterium]|nr:1-deoxy-D-xylulose-5-phosphate reductoisomerase [Verrucomicrobiales bacterium]